MRTTIITLALLLFAVHAQASALYDQLRAFNPYWEDHRPAVEGLPAAAIHNDVDYVRVHLAQVLGVLSGAPLDHLTSDQLATRKELVAVLSAYADQGRFPINYYRRERIPVFIDEHETFCAVGHLMRYTGKEAMARRIAAANNHACVREIEEPGLAGWQVASGFTLDELKLIQGAYDFYLQDAFLLPNKYEVPQKPEQVVRYFDGKEKRVWCLGEGADGDLHGRWIQNYSASLPWIEGYFEHGKRSGRWKEYYKGTEKLCRTEHWRDDQLNGIRTRYDREGKVIETILFKNGEAVTKTNFDHDKALRWVRSPIDSATVYTEIFTTEGGLIAAGKERIHNPEGLLWFQNIELTALNSFAISARDGAPRPEEGVTVPWMNQDVSNQQLPGAHALVEYKKLGDWVYYKDYLDPLLTDANRPTTELSKAAVFALGYLHYGTDLYRTIASYDHLELTASYDSMHVVYDDDRMVDLVGFRSADQDHLQFTYHHSDVEELLFLHARRQVTWKPAPRIKRITRLDVDGNFIGVRADYDKNGHLTRREEFLMPYKQEEEELVLD